MTDLAIDQNTGDVLIVNGGPVLVEGADAIGQRIYMKLRTFRGEHFLDQRAGLPYHDRILIRGANEADLFQIYQDGILSVPGVETVDKLVIDFGDSDTRTLRVTADITTTEGEVSLIAEVPSGS